MRKDLPGEWSGKALVLALLWFGATGFVAPEQDSDSKDAETAGQTVTGEHVVRPDVYRSTDLPKYLGSSGLSHVKRDRLTGVIRSVSGRLSGKVSARSSVDDRMYMKLIRSWLASPEGRWTGVSFEDLRPEPAAWLRQEDSRFYKFRVLRDGLVIKDSSLDFRFRQGYLIQVIGKTFAEALPRMEGGSLENPAAYLSLPAGAQLLGETEDLYRVVADQEQGRYELVRVREYQIMNPDGENYQAQVDVHTGKLLEYKSGTYHYALEARGEAHPRWYMQPLQAYPLKSLKIAGQFTDRSGRLADAGENTPELNALHGKYVQVFNQTGNSVRGSGVLSDGLWRLHLEKPGNEVSSQDSYLAQIMVYRSTDLISRFAAQYINHEWLEKSLTANVNLSRSCNAHYSANTINFYSGSDTCANTGLIADVIYHEWGHALDDQTGGIQDGAFSEGFGDIVSLLISRSPKLGIGFRLPDYGPVRDLEPDRIYPRDASGGVHAEGLIIGSTFWDLFVAFRDLYGEASAADQLARYAFRMIMMADTYRDVYDALLVIDDTNGDLRDGTPNLCTINKVFSQHGLAEEQPDCRFATVSEWKFSNQDGRENAILLPGEQVNLMPVVSNQSDRVLEGLTGILSVENTDSGTRVSDQDLYWSSVAVGEDLMATKAAKLEVSESALCGDQLSLKLMLQEGGRSAVYRKSFVIGQELIGAVQTFSAEGLPLPIQDRKNTEARLKMTGSEQWPEDARIASARLKFDITHSYQGDLTVHLSAPDGSSFAVYKGEGGGDNVHFDKDLSSLLKGMSGGGVWSLHVKDGAVQDEGTLDAVSLELTPVRYVCQ